MDDIDNEIGGNEIIGIAREILHRVSCINNKLPIPVNNDIEYPKNMLITVLVIFGTLAGLSVIGSVITFLTEGLYYDLGFEGGASTYKEDSSFALSLREDDLLIYGFDDSPVSITPTDLFSDLGNTMDSGRVILTQLTSAPGDPVIYSVNILTDPFARGLFSGWLGVAISGETVYVPLTMSSGVYGIAPIFLVLTGVCTSVCLWEIIRYFKYRGDLNKRSNLLAQKRALEAGFAESDLETFDSNYQKTLQEIRYYDAHLDNYIRRDQQTAKTTLSIGIIEFVSALFGVVIGLFVIFGEVSSSNDLVISPFEAILLFGIGLGAGSLKELVDK